MKPASLLMHSLAIWLVCSCICALGFVFWVLHLWFRVNPPRSRSRFFSLIPHCDCLSRRDSGSLISFSHRRDRYSYSLSLTATVCMLRFLEYLFWFTISDIWLRFDFRLCLIDDARTRRRRAIEIATSSSKRVLPFRFFFFFLATECNFWELVSEGC